MGNKESKEFKELKNVELDERFLMLKKKYGSSFLKFIADLKPLDFELIQYAIEQGEKLNAKTAVKSKRNIIPIEKKCVNFVLIFNQNRDEKITLDILDWLLENGGDLNLQFLTPLHMLCDNRSTNTETIRFLIEKGYNLSLKTLTSFHMLCDNKSINTETIRLLIEKGYNFNMKIDTPLHFLCRNSAIRIDMLRLLKEKQVDFKMKNVSEKFYQSKRNSQKIPFFFIFFFLERCIQNDHLFKKKNITNSQFQFLLIFQKQTPIHFLCKNSSINIDMIRFLIENGADFNMQSETPFHLLCKNDSMNSDILFFLIEKGANLRLRNESAFHFLCRNECMNMNILRFLIEKEIKFNRRTETPLHFLCQNRSFNTEMLRLLMEKGVSFQKKSETPLHFLCQNRSFNTEMLRLLMEKGVDFNLETAVKNFWILSFDFRKLSSIQYLNLNQNNRTRNLNTEFIRILISKGFDLNLVNETPLHFLCKSDDINPDIIRILITNGANFNIQNKNNIIKDNTPLHFLCKSDDINSDIIRILITNGANFNIQNKNNIIKDNTPLHFICRNRILTSQMLRVLVSNGANFNISNGTPLHVICERKEISLEMLKILIENGANFTIPIETPLHILCKNKKFNLAMFRLLVERGANFNIKDDVGVTPLSLCEPLFQTLHSSFLSFLEDFQNLFEKHELTDFQISKFPVHRLMIELRTGKKAEQVRETLEKATENQIMKILRWIYFGRFKRLNSSDTIAKKQEEAETQTIYKTQEELQLYQLLKQIGIENPNERNIFVDIQKLYYQDDTKDFQIEVEGKNLKVHKLILQARSQLFRQMFISVDDKSNRTKDFSEQTYQNMSLFIKFLYTDRITQQDYEEMITKQENLFDFDFFFDFFQLHPNSSLQFYKEKFKDN
ncbi:ankyrin repeat-containing protein [Anaeramoeba ignava]|uniref:Ankyrin repeat-containing protein n=1 Tax=Anaeramoeba ignava TaxID=1746090 RepID=A0A9Q0LMR5_ANAIG|nr:ankyrin repeat-containing protein [Anaeramoeba ignava]